MFPTFGEISRYALHCFDDCSKDIAGMPRLASNSPLRSLLCGRVRHCSRVCWRPWLKNIQEPLKETAQRLLAVLSAAGTHSERLPSFESHNCRHIPYIQNTHHAGVKSKAVLMLRKIGEFCPSILSIKVLMLTLNRIIDMLQGFVFSH